MLATMTPKQFNEWLADYSIEPWGSDWRQTAVICTTVANSILKAIATFAQIRLDKEDYFSEEDFMPGRGASKKRKRRYLSVDEAEIVMRSMYG